MMILMMNFLLVNIVCMIIILKFLILSKKSMKDREKNSPFECGFDPLGYGRIPFSLRFFLIAIIFLIFDIEIVLILPIPLSLSDMDYYYIFYISELFLILLLIGLFYEWNQGALDWAILMII